VERSSQLNVLIVDDSREKVERICEVLKRSGVERAKIEVVGTVLEARSRLRAEMFDLVVVDIALPVRAGEKIEWDGGLRLLEDVFSRDSYRKPAHVVGLSAYPHICARYEAWFAERLWHLLRYNQSGNAWEHRLGKLANYLVEAEGIPNVFQTDVCVVTALMEPELSAVLELPWSWEMPAVLDGSTLFYRGRVCGQRREMSVIAATVGRSGMVPAAIMCTKLLSEFRPRFLIIGGICAGVEGKVQMGDVVIANMSWDWQYGKVVAGLDGATFLNEPVQLGLPSYATTQCNRLREDIGFQRSIPDAWNGEVPNERVSVHIGPLASGATVVADSQTFQGVKLQQRNLLGLDMEAYSVFAAAHFGPFPHPTALCVKGVSDFGGGDKCDKWRNYASFASAKVVQRLVEVHLEPIYELAGSL